MEGAALSELGAQALEAGEEAQALDLARRALETLEGLELPAQQRQASLVLGGALLALGQTAAAGGAYRRALLLGRATGGGHLDGDALAGLARAALAQGALDEALGHVTVILERFALDAARIALRGTQCPATICLACHETLHAAGDREPAAVAILAAGHRLLLERAGALPPAERQDYLEGVPAQRALLRAWEAALAGGRGGELASRSPTASPPGPPPGPPPIPVALLLAR